MFPVNLYFIVRSIATVREWTCVFFYLVVTGTDHSGQ